MGFILGLHGAAKAGKDTVADYILSEYSWGEKLSFAGNLKEMCKVVFQLTDEDVNTQEGKERPFPQPKTFTQRNLGSVLYWMAQTHSAYPPAKGSREKLKTLIGTELSTPRQVLQFVGTDVCRTVVPSYHGDVVIKKIKDNPDTNFVITDVRFPDEGDLILDDYNGIVVEVLRESTSKENIDRSHASETAMQEWGRFTDVVNNQKDGLPFLFAEVNNLLKRHNLWQETTTQSSKPQRETSSPTVGTDDQNDIGTTGLTSSINVASE
jgi:hypothetical protein